MKRQQTLMSYDLFTQKIETDLEPFLCLIQIQR
ncbi:hypothetical protein F943_01874 [Acinetobacter ursingii NIPH 706]|nr:hypothetical protein F943_01874 [Acinetobacter ursingii NIPH 706]